MLLVKVTETRGRARPARKSVALAELPANDFDRVAGVRVVFGVDEGFGHIPARGEGVGSHVVPAQLLYVSPVTKRKFSGRGSGS
jgi:hypothetical protein